MGPQKSKEQEKKQGSKLSTLDLLGNISDLIPSINTVRIGPWTSERIKPKHKRAMGASGQEAGRSGIGDPSR